MAGRLHIQAATDDAPSLTWRMVKIEREILYVLDAKPAFGEQIEMTFRRKEAELRTLFAYMCLADARELHRRLTLCLSDDPIATRFFRLVAERRARLLTFLGDARRRHALGVAR